MENTVVISRESYEKLIEDQKFLWALQNCGVDCWKGYEEAQELYQEWKDDTKDSEEQ